MHSRKLELNDYQNGESLAPGVLLDIVDFSKEQRAVPSKTM
jgi:hypothetical protein